jgi:alpha-tubulin suppressor-like RCC1 family protein
VLRQDGTVWFFGLPFDSVNCEGCSINVPRHVGGLTNVTAIASGGTHALALESDGTVWSWGHNELGQLGNQLVTAAPVYPPTQIPGLDNIQSIATSAPSSFAVAADGTVWAWGDNSSGQLGDGTTTNYPSPIHLTTISNVRAIATNGNCTYAVKTDGTIWSWGSNQNGILGTGGSAASLSPAQITGLSNITAVAHTRLPRGGLRKRWLSVDVG